MSLEIKVDEFFVIELITKEILDSPTLGASYTVKLSTAKFGPYNSRLDAEKKIAILKIDQTTKGWKESKQNKYSLFKGDLDTNYSIKHEIDFL